MKINWHLNLVINLWRNVLLRHAKIAQLLVKCTSGLYFSHSIKQPGNSQYLRSLLNVNYTKHGKPYRPHWYESAKLSMVAQWQQREMVKMVEDTEKSECLAVMARIGLCELLHSVERAEQQSLNWQDCRNLLMEPI